MRPPRHATIRDSRPGKGDVSLIYLNAFVLALVEGITEFLPISSTGHMILVEQYFPLTANPEDSFRHAFIELIQLPAILAVVVYFWKRIFPFTQPPEQRNATIKMWMYVVAAFIPAVVIGVFVKDFIEEKLFYPFPIAVALFVGGILLIIIERRKHTERYTTVTEFPLYIAIGIGLFQCLAFMPGTSRSAATIIGAMLLGASRLAAAEFSFFLAIPTMCAVCAANIFEYGLSFTGQEWSLLALGSIVSFITAYAAVAFLMRYIQRHDFTAFGVYRIILGGIVLLAYLV